MKNERNLKLMNYLYPNEQIRRFMCDDLYMELMQIIPNICISSKNVYISNRKENYNKVFSLVLDFLKSNQNYLNQLNIFYKNKTLSDIVKDIVIGYTFFLGKAYPKYNQIDIFKNTKSICYSPISVIDIL